LYLLAGLRQRGHRVRLCCPRAGALFERAADAGIEVTPLTLRSGMDFPSAVRLARLGRDLDVDLVHVHDARSHAIGRIAQGLSSDGALADNLFVTRRSLGGPGGRLDRIKYAARGVRYIAISKAVRDSLLRLGVDPADVALVPSGVDVEHLAAARAAREDRWGLRARNRWVVGTVGELSREKNHVLLLEAFARFRTQQPDAHLVLVGDGALRAALERRARTLGLEDAVTFAGRLADPAPVIGSFDVFALTSDVEGLGTSLLDAMSAGVPVVTTAAGGVLDVARHGDSALVVPPRDVPALAGALQLIRDKPDLALQLVEGGRAVAARHGIDAMVEGTLAAYARLGRPPGTAAVTSGRPAAERPARRARSDGAP
jgi:glycosyltransferase involved in cell wall biosynthesis